MPTHPSVRQPICPFIYPYPFIDKSVLSSVAMCILTETLNLLHIESTKHSKMVILCFDVSS